MRFFTLTVCLLGASILSAQKNPHLLPRDTFLKVELMDTDVFDYSVGAPMGNDSIWVLYDEDGFDQICATEITHGWYIASDLADTTNTNLCFTSCSYLAGSPYPNPCALKNRNWLITLPIHIGGTNALLNWKSDPYEGPAFMDGYVVLVSTGTNLPFDFKDTLFVAAEMIKSKFGNNYSFFDTSKYVFSPGYVHANGYTDTNYYFHALDPGNTPILQGRLEPHQVDLSGYFGKTIYIAFLHNSLCDDVLQIDDIIVSSDSITATHAPDEVRSFKVTPNPTSGLARISFELGSPQPVQIQVVDLFGRIIWTDTGLAQPTVSYNKQVDLISAPAGMYHVILKTVASVRTLKLIKR
jgi:hypothetical protein